MENDNYTGSENGVSARGYEVKIMTTDELSRTWPTPGSTRRARSEGADGRRRPRVHS